MKAFITNTSEVVLQFFTLSVFAWFLDAESGTLLADFASER
jgi:hypothetical protein